MDFYWPTPTYGHYIDSEGDNDANMEERQSYCHFLAPSQFFTHKV